MSEERRNIVPPEHGVNQRTPQQESVDLMEIAFVLLQRLWLIILCAAIGAASFFSYTYLRVAPTYTTTAKMYVVSASNNSVVNLSDLQLGTNLKADYQQLLKSRPLLEDVIASLNLPVSADDLSKMISIGNPADTRILTVTVTSTSPQQAADIANELANQAKVFLPAVMKMEEPSIYEYALVPTFKSGPDYTRSTLMGALVGGALSAGIVILIHMMNDTLVTPDDVRNYLGITPLATIAEGDLGDFNRKKRRSGKEGKKA